MKWYKDASFILGTSDLFLAVVHAFMGNYIYAVCLFFLGILCLKQSV